MKTSFKVVFGCVFIFYSAQGCWHAAFGGGEDRPCECRFVGAAGDGVNVNDEPIRSGVARKPFLADKRILAMPSIQLPAYSAQSRPAAGLFVCQRVPRSSSPSTVPSRQALNVRPRQMARWSSTIELAATTSPRR